MPKISPISWKKFIACLRRYGFTGPYQIGKHPYMVFGSVRLTIPNPHDGDISIDLLARILRQANISRDEWLKLL
jgi:predicted RNA binding protein YcfA (HicA-like mRNA interferase family)